VTDMGIIGLERIATLEVLNLTVTLQSHHLGHQPSSLHRVA
jgi:hypothetical protein